MVCKKCGEQVKTNNNSQDENIFYGCIGALLGSLIGAVVIIVLGQLGFIASAAGLAMAIGTISMYEKFAKGIRKLGIVICIIVMLVMTLLAVNMSISIQLAGVVKEQGLDANVITIFRNFFKIVEAGAIDKADYIGELVMVYLFAILGAFGTIKAKISELKGNR